MVDKPAVKKAKSKTKDKDCGLIMPISELDGCPSHHWSDVKSILEDAVREAGFNPSMVSDADEVALIQKTIIQNVYSNEIVVCDVSGKNSNVMFELGLRLAFDKPTIIVKDDKTDYSFDTSVIEHLGYRRDLRYESIIEFIAKLSNKIKATYEKSLKDVNYSPFLKSFGQYEIAQLEKEQVTSQEYVMEHLRELSSQVSALRNELRGSKTESAKLDGSKRRIALQVVLKAMADYANEMGIKMSTLAGTRPEDQSELTRYLMNRDDIQEACYGDLSTLMQIMRKIL